MNKRVHQIAKEQGLTAKELLALLREAGHEVKAASSNVDEALALKVLPNGGNSAAPEAPAAAAPTAAPQSRPEAAPKSVDG
ncbi:MAG TPA: translation initiation factor IF-2 N-terminal domain-containing protein, partial [Solirubrobacteraceae bacterium]|nr:translation initiation factor IF-2 N-terminal domain-containing protein [Solirubrobacteraceae bacterium]